MTDEEFAQKYRQRLIDKKYLTLEQAKDYPVPDRSDMCAVDADDPEYCADEEILAAAESI